MAGAGRPRLGRAGLAALLAVLGAAALSGVLAPPAASASTAPVSPVHRMAGMDFLTLGTVPDPSSFAQLAADGVNTVSFDVWWAVPSAGSNDIAPLAGATISDSALETLTQDAEAAGLAVTLTPKFFVGNYQGWRGGYDPPDPATFFANYTQMVDHYAAMAQATGMSMFFVGSEMDHTLGYVSRWRSLISSVRSHYQGQLSYANNWDSVDKVQFWDALDLITLSAYYPVSNAEYPTEAELQAGWTDYKEPGSTVGNNWVGLLASVAQRWHKPLLFGEAGYMASTYTGKSPCCPSVYTYDAGLQAAAYQALLSSFQGQPWWAGVSWWAWNDDPYDRSPGGKPAEQLIGAQNVGAASPAAAAPFMTSPAPSPPPPATTTTLASPTTTSRSPGSTVGPTTSTSPKLGTRGRSTTTSTAKAKVPSTTLGTVALGVSGEQPGLAVPALPPAKVLTRSDLQGPPFSLTAFLRVHHARTATAGVLAIAAAFLALAYVWRIRPLRRS